MLFLVLYCFLLHFFIGNTGKVRKWLQAVTIKISDINMSTFSFKLLKYILYISHEPRVRELDLNAGTAKSNTAWTKRFRWILSVLVQA